MTWPSIQTGRQVRTKMLGLPRGSLALQGLRFRDLHPCMLINVSKRCGYISGIGQSVSIVGQCEGEIAFAIC